MGDRMIFHFPRTIIGGGSSGTFVRPSKMMQAFRDIGYDVVPVTGYQAERQAAMIQIRREHEGGEGFDFVYSETINGPLRLVERSRRHDPAGRDTGSNPIIGSSRDDFRFFDWARSHGIPVGLFCRDVHWLFPHGSGESNWLRGWFRRRLFRDDWKNYAQSVDHLFVPTLAMSSALPIPWPPQRLTALPPGCQPIRKTDAPRRQEASPLRIFYVGGIAPPLYDLRPMFRAVQRVENVQLTVCCRQPEWERHREIYGPIDAQKIRIVHVSGSQLTPFYEDADLFGVVWKPYDYWNHTVSLKVYETIGAALPIAITAGSIAAKFVEEEKTGWVVGGEEGFIDLLHQLQQEPRKLSDCREHIRLIQSRHTWRARALTAKSVLSSYAHSSQ